MEWIEISIFTSWEATEAVANILHDVGVTGVVIEDPQLWKKRQREAQFDEVWELENIEDSNQVTVRGYLPTDDFLTERIEKVRVGVANLPSFGLDIGQGEIKLNKVAEEDWSTSWKAYFKPEHIGNKLVVKPTWEEYEAKDEEIIIHLDPGMAFGTGTHETTSMCMEMLEKYLSGGEIVYDVGTGSGILSLTAAKLGAKEITAWDVDLLAVKVAQENVKINNLENRITVHFASLPEKYGQSDVITANLVANIIIQLAPNFYHNLKPNGLLIASGIIVPREEEVMQSLNEQGMKLKERRQEGDWLCLVLEKK